MRVQAIPLRRGGRGAVVLAMVLGLLAAGLTAAVAGAQPAADRFSVLVFSKTEGFRHDSIPDGIAAIEELGEEHDFAVDATEDAEVFTDEGLAPYDAVIWLSTTGDVLDDAQQDAFEAYIQGGGGYAGVHAASDTEYDWPWYGGLVGAYFASHPENQTATVEVEDHDHPSTAHLDDEWTRYDEWYNFQTNPRDSVRVLLSLDEESYQPGDGAMGDHPIAWCHAYDGGRAWYTGMGHTSESFAEPDFLTHLLGGIESAAGQPGAECTEEEPAQDGYAVVPLDETSANPMDLAVADDGRTFYIDRGGEVRLVRANGTVTTAADLDVYTGQEFGLVGLALDPNFADNNWVYLYYAPDGDEEIDRVSRFTLDGENLDPASESVVLELESNREECCHAGGALEFDTQGNLYIATGDLTNPFDSDGYTPIDERPGRELWDAQRTAANSDSLSGKILRIAPLAAGGYAIPDGNMFAEDAEDARAEIYAMGFRNPFTIGLDPATDALLVADYGPDAATEDPDRGPDGRVEWNVVDQTGFYGWPYCVGDNTPYIDHDFDTGESSGEFDCAGGVVNDSPNNTGQQQLPPALPSALWMGASSTGSPEIGTSGAPTTSGVYYYDEELDSPRKWPDSWDGHALFGDWNNGRMFSIEMEGSAAGEVTRIFEEWEVKRPHALRFGPDGALYFIDWGDGFGGDNADSGVYRVDYLADGGYPPVARVQADVRSGPAPLEVAFTSEGSFDPGGSELSYAWDFDGDGETDSTEAAPTHVFEEPGAHQVSLTVTNDSEGSAVAGVEIVSGNTAPEITVQAPADGGFFSWGDTIPYEVTITDAEDGEIDCDRVVTQPALGHDEHAHGYEQYYGCSGEFPLPGDEGHTGANIFGVVTVTYTDLGAPGTVPLTSQEVLQLHTRVKEAEFHHASGRVADGSGANDPGVTREPTEDTGGGANITGISDGDWYGWDPMTLGGIDQVDFRVASGAEGGVIEVRIDDPEDGEVVATAEVQGTGGWQEWETVSADISDHEPGDALYFVVRGEGSEELLNINWMEFHGDGVTAGAATG